MLPNLLNLLFVQKKRQASPDLHEKKRARYKANPDESYLDLYNIDNIDNITLEEFNQLYKKNKQI